MGVVSAPNVHSSENKCTLTPKILSHVTHEALVYGVFILNILHKNTQLENLQGRVGRLVDFASRDDRLGLGLPKTWSFFFSYSASLDFDRLGFGAKSKKKQS